MQNARRYVKQKAKSPNAAKEKSALWRAANPETVKEIRKRAHEKNAAKRNAQSLAYRAAHLEQQREASRAWSKNNPAKVRIAHSRRRAANKNGRRVRDSEFDQFFIKEIYALAQLRTRATGIKWHVDHVVPLQSKLVSGLHCAANLQLLPQTENYRKGNRVWPDMS
jgi:transposase